MQFFLLCHLVSVVVLTSANEPVTLELVKKPITVCDVCRNLVTSANQWAAVDVATRMKGMIDYACAESQYDSPKCKKVMHAGVKNIVSTMINQPSPVATCAAARVCSARDL